MNMFHFQITPNSRSTEGGSSIFLKSSTIFHSNSSVIFNYKQNLYEFIIQFTHGSSTYMVEQIQMNKVKSIRIIDMIKKVKRHC